MTAISVVTPWLNAHELIPAYSRALDYGLRDRDRLIVVDNCSDPPLRIGPADLEIHLFENLGFSGACNAGLAEVETDAVLFLNNDISMTSPEWLDQIRSALRPGVLVGAQLRIDAHARVDGRTIPYLDGWCVGGMTEEIRALGGFDSLEEPAYYSDNILSVRAKARGMKLVQVPVGLKHIGNYSTRRMNVDGVSQRNRERYEEIVRELLCLSP